MLIILADVFRGFPWSLQANSRIFSQLGHDHFHPDPFQYIFMLDIDSITKNESVQ
jgi:hypothetical protein